MSTLAASFVVASRTLLRQNMRNIHSDLNPVGHWPPSLLIPRSKALAMSMTSPRDDGTHSRSTATSFRSASQQPQFFYSRRDLVRRNPKMKPGDVPILVIPSLHEQVHGHQRSSARELITCALPRIASRAEEARTERSRRCNDGLGSCKARPPVQVKLPKLTFSTDSVSIHEAQRVQQPALHSVRYLRDYDGGVNAALANDSEPTTLLIDQFERQGEANAQSNEALGLKTLNTHHITTVDEEASIRVLKMMFQLSLTKNSNIISRLKALDFGAVQKRLAQEMSHRKQLSRDEFHGLIGKLLKEDFPNRRDTSNLFSLFDDDKSGMVEAVEFVSGFLNLIGSAEDDVSFKFLNMLLDGREKATVNAFISRFELQILIASAQRFYVGDPQVVQILEEFTGTFNFSHHMGRIPVAEFRRRVIENDDLRAIFENLPNPSKVGATIADSVIKREASLHASEQVRWATDPHLVANQFLNSNHDVQAAAEEHDNPRWTVCGDTVYRSSDSHPSPEPMFFSR